MSETVTWVSDEDGSFVVTVGGLSQASGSCTANTEVTTDLPFADFTAGDNSLEITVTNANGTGTATVTIIRLGGPASTGLCWSPPLLGEVPRTELDADPLANRMGQHVKGPSVAKNVFILQSGKIVNDWVDATDPIRVALFGAGVDQHVSAGDAALLVAAGYGANLVRCPSSGFGGGGFGSGGFGG